MIITVVGLGVVGGSFVKALKGQGHEVYGIDVDEETLARAKADGCIKEGFVDGREIIKRSDMTIICLYPSLVLDYIKEHEFKKGSIITDAVGVKTHFLNEAMNLLKDKDVEFVSGHPMAGRENKGYLYASKEVFQGANYILIQHEQNSKSAIAMMEQFVSNLGFHSVKIMSPQAHDEIISFTSQLPHVIAVSLIDSDNQKYDTGKYIGDSYRDLTRIANINEDLWAELFFTNKDNLLKSIQGFEDQLDILKKAIKETKGEIITYQGECISALFYSSSNGKSENVENYFIGSAKPYLVSVDSHWDESYDPHFLKEKEFSKTSLKQMFKGSFNYQILSYYPSGRIQTIKINNQNYTGRQMREKLQLASSDFTIVEKSDSYVFKTKGSGHGVGLSQYGAQGMAKEGYDYQQILKHYYQGVEISKNN